MAHTDHSLVPPPPFPNSFSLFYFIRKVGNDSDMSLASLSPYTFGCMSLGTELAMNRISEDVRVARKAMEAGIWFHCSPTYSRGFSFMILRMAFDQDRTNVPPLIVKVRDASPDLMRFEVEDACRRLGIDAIDIAQLVSMERGPDNLLSQLSTGGPIADELAHLRKRGLIKQAVVFVDKENSDAGVAAQSSELVEGITCYWNAQQRELTPAAWETIQNQNIPLIALRTLAGASELDSDMTRLLKESDCDDHVEFALRLQASYPQVSTTIGGTRNKDHLQRFLDCMNRPALPESVLEVFEKLKIGSNPSA